jgi:putative endonuclease
VTKTHTTGTKGEDVAVQFLKARGFRVLERNYSVQTGEIDIIAESYEGTLHFVEVKTSARALSREIGDYWPEERVNTKKQEHILKTAEVYLKGRDIAAQCDVIAVILDDKNGKAHVRFVENAF